MGDSYLEEESVQAFGISRADNAIRVYVEAKPSTDLEVLIDEIKQAAEPYDVIVINAEAASVH